MDTDTYPREDVQKFLAGVVCVKVNPEEGEANAKLKGTYGVKGYPCLILEDPLGKQFMKCAGKPGPEHFVEECWGELYTEMYNASESTPPDLKKCGETGAEIARWFAGTEGETRAASLKAKHAQEAAFTEAWDARLKAIDEGIQKAKDDAAAAKAAAEKKELEDAKAAADKLLSSGKRKQAFDAYRGIIAAHPDSEQAEAARKILKKNLEKWDEPKK